MIKSKEYILTQLARSNNPESPLPDLSILDSFLDSSLSLIEGFSTMLSGVGGKTILTNSNQDLEKQIIDCGVKPNLENAICLASNIFNEVEKSYTNLSISSLSKIDYAIVPAEFGVSENGAVWIKEPNNIHRSILFIVQHLIVVLSKDALIANMHEAYKRLNEIQAFSGVGFGTFISGPSKTADIEQSLVIGAHGPRSHIVYIT